MSAPVPPAAHHMAEHVLAQLTRHRARFAASPTRAPPLFVAVQGPQGSGKTFLTARLRALLSAPPHALTVAVLSIDDLYLPHARLAALAAAHPHNALLRGRGQPGTHDVPLGVDVLAALQHINDPPADAEGERVVEVPRFDKSLFAGEGDRLPAGTRVAGPVDVVALEGWCVGFAPATPEEIAARWAQPVRGLGLDFFGARGFRVEDVLDVNERLRAYEAWWAFFDVLIQIKPVEDHPYDYIYKWRLQQEHHMKASNGGKGMTDEQVETFVDRYIPGYVFFGDGVTQAAQPWIGNGLVIAIGEEREVLQVTNF